MNEVAFRRLDREPLGGLAHTQLCDALLDGRFPPGGALTLRGLADSFGVSVTPVRDAVSRLIAQGVLELGPRGTAVVPDIGAKALRDIMMARTELEGRAAFEAARNASAAAAQALETQLVAMKAMISARDFEAYLDQHRRFHFSVYELADAPILVSMIHSLWLRAGPVLSLVVPDYVLTLKGSDRHTAIVEAIRIGDGDAARAEMVADIAEAAGYLTTLADDQGKIRRR